MAFIQVAIYRAAAEPAVRVPVYRQYTVHRPYLQEGL